MTVSLQAMLGLLCLASPIVAQKLDAAAAACQFLDSSIGNGTVLPTDGRYRNLTEANWVQTAWALPTCIIQPITAEDLSEAVKHLVAEDVHFAVRSGGHSPVPLGANIDEGGVLIDMSNFNTVEYHANSSVAVVGSGLRWGEVYTQLDPYNVTVVGGRILDVGVGGLILGSGLSYLSDLYGLACDNVVNFEVVLADGSIVNANAGSNSDLWWSLKGGANNFGIVTRFTLTTYPIGNIWGGVKAYTLDALPALFDAMLEYQSVAEKDPYANLMLQAFPLNATLGVVLNMVYMKPEESPSAFEAFYDIETIADTTQIQSLTSFLASQQAPSLPRLDWFATSFKPDAGLYKTVAETLTSAPELSEIQNLTAGSIAIGWQPISTSAIEAGNARGGNALGLDCANQTWLVIDVGWWDEGDDDTANGATLSMIDKIEAASQGTGNYVDYIFMNDASVEQPVIEHYGPENLAKLRDVQRVHDPDLVFQKLVPGGFKIPV
ncbi:Uu.00g050430.m01.CDS01 [Anthostomella pinea]|uniref:Uu.00g050430.m01.CDS01 n=1 Tax=Anthostomella pinea TaxID=933095 RepID=A0AAI8YMR9_9PEZI|nr:Uu.00g050430.m01.CDS01 [Anthostomella pinea]